MGSVELDKKNNKKQQGDTSLQTNDVASAHKNLRPPDKHPKATQSNPHHRSIYRKQKSFYPFRTMNTQQIRVGFLNAGGIVEHTHLKN